MAYTKHDSVHVPNPLCIWKKEMNKVSMIPVTNLICSTVHVSVNFILIVGTHTGIKSTFLRDVLLKKKETCKTFDADALDFFGEFKNTTPKKRPLEDSESLSSSLSTTTTTKPRLIINNKLNNHINKYGE